MRIKYNLKQFFLAINQIILILVSKI